MEKRKANSDVIEAARGHLGTIDLLCRLLFLAAATPGFQLDRCAIGHLAGMLHNFRNRHAEILAREGI
jgi:hypothetical protein